jgi:nicotinate phosphoribosyltransferase
MTTEPAAKPRFLPAADVLSGDTADVYFERARRILAAERIDPVVAMEIFTLEEAVLCGAEEAHAYLREILRRANGQDPPAVVESLHDGDLIGPKEVVMRITARYSAFGLYETAILGILSQSTGWATAARRIVDIAAPIPVIGFGARHVHPSVADQMDYASVVGGCVGASTPAGARLAGLAPTGTMPHALILIFGDTVRAAEAFDRHTEPDVPRIVLVDTFKDEAEESLRVAEALGSRLWGVRLDTPSERGRVTADLVKEVRARLDAAGHQHVRIVVSGGLDAERIAYFKEAAAPIDSFAVGSAISDASPIDFTGDLKEIDGRPIAKRGRIPGRTENPRLERIDLS